MAANPAPQVVNVIGQDGELRGVPAQHLQDVLRSGAFRVATPDETAAYWKEQDFGGAAQGAAAFGEGALSALTFGAGPKLEEFLGVDPAGIAGRKEVHPIAHGAGEVAGVLAPLALTAGAAAPAEAGAGAAVAAGEAAAGVAPAVAGAGEAAAAAAPSLLSRVAGFTAPGLISRAGRAAEAATEGMLPGVVGRILPSAALGATEGALYSGSDLVEKKLLGDPGLTAEKALAEVGVGALFGGTLGAAGKSLSELMPESLAESMSDKLGETAGHRNLKAAAGPGGSKAIIKRLQRQYGKDNLTKIGQEMGDMGLVGPLSTPEQTYEAARALKAAAGDEMGAILETADKAGAGAPLVKDVIGRARAEILQPLVENPLEQGTARQLGEILDGYEAKFAGAPVAEDAQIGFQQLHDIRKQVSDKLYGLRGTQDPAASALKDSLHDFRSLISDEINTGLDKAGMASDAWKAANRKYTVGSVAQKLAEDGMLKHQGNNLLSLTEIMAGLTGAASNGIGLGGLAALGTHFAREHASGIIGWAATAAQRRLLNLAAGSERSLRGAVDAIFNEAIPAAGASGAAKLTESRLTPEKFTDVASNLRDYGSNPDKLAETVGKQTAALQKHAPGAADAASALAARYVQHLNSVLPQGPAPAPLSNEYKPSVAELVPFNRAQEIAHAPMNVLEHIRRGTLDRVHVATAETIWPKLTQEMRAQVTEKLAEMKAAGKPIPRHSRLALSMFLGSDLDRSTVPSVIAAHQATFRNAPQSPSPGPAPTKGGSKASHIKSPASFATLSQKMAGRDVA